MNCLAYYDFTFLNPRRRFQHFPSPTAQRLLSQPQERQNERSDTPRLSAMGCADPHTLPALRLQALVA